MLAAPLIFALVVSTLCLMIGWIADIVVANRREARAPIDSDLAYGWETSGHPMAAAR